MSNKKKLLRSDIIYECDEECYEQGMTFFRHKQIVAMDIKSQGALYVQLTGQVKDVINKPYSQIIRIVWSPSYSLVDIDGECNCSVGFNCKHVAAVCIYYQQSLSDVSQQTQPECLAWLNQFAKDDDSPVKKSFSAETTEFIAYILRPSHVPHEYIFDFVITKEKKNGGLVKGRKTNISNLRYSHALLGYFQPEDDEIIKILLALNTLSGFPVLSGSVGYLAITCLLKTKRLYWLDIEGDALQPSEARELQLAWQQSANGEFSLHPFIGEGAQVLLTTPPLYVSPQHASIGEINGLTISIDELKKILTAPVVPVEFAEEFSQQLAFKYPDLPLPPPKKIDVIDIEKQCPVPTLMLMAIDEQTKNEVYCIVLSFAYGEYELDAEIICPEYSLFKSSAGILRIHRDSEAELNAMHTLSTFGFLTNTLVTTTENILFFFSPSETSSLESITRWSQFLTIHVDQLREQGWNIVLDESFNLDFQQLDSWDAEVSEAGNDWFEMRFNVEINGKSLALLPVIMSALEYYDLEDLPEILSIPIDHHQFINIPSEKLRPFLRILYELFSISHASITDGALKLSRYHLASLAELEAHSYGVFALSGGQALRELGQKLKDFSGVQQVAAPTNLLAELRTYQQQGLNWLQFLREYRFGGILADDMGLGKTIQALSHLLLEKQEGRMNLPSLIIAPTSLMSNWRREAQRFTPDLTVLILQGTERKTLFEHIYDYDVVLTTYPLLPRDEEALLVHEYYYLLLDEAQIIKNPQAKASRIVRKINAQHRLCLTGTPMENHLGELWAQFDFLMPGFLGDKASFTKNYRTPIEMHGDGEQKKRLANRVKPFMLRRTKHEVATELPLKTEIIRSVPLHPKQAALYESIRLTMEQKVRDAIAQKGLSRSHITILDALLKLRQTCCDPRTLPLKEAQKITESAKLDLLMEMLPELLNEGRKILVFSQFTRMLSIIEKTLQAQKIGYTKLTGQTKNRDDAIEEFKNGNVNVFLISLKAGGVGLNLTEADTVIIYDPWWNPAAETQAADRAYRIGQDKPVFVYKLLTENTVEEKILAMQDKKRVLANSIYNAGDEQSQVSLTAEDLALLFEPI